jgi:uncharacterized protein YjbI with pentapeptide repeats
MECALAISGTPRICSVRALRSVSLPFMIAEIMELDWPACKIDGCRGRQVDGDSRCLAHTTKDKRETIFAQLAIGAAVEAVTGVQFSEDLLADLLAAVPRNDEGAPVLHDADFRRAVLPTLDLQRATLVNARFDGASFQGDVRFSEASFEGDIEFSGTSFWGAAWFWKANFQGIARFGGASFQDLAVFHGVLFQDDARFVEANFQSETTFHAASFQGDAEFNGAAFDSDADFGDAVFQDGAGFRWTTFLGDATCGESIVYRDAWFDEASFQGDAEFGWVRFHGDARFDQARFQQPIELVSLAVAGTLFLDEVESDQPVQLEVAAWRLSCKRARFRGGGHLRIAWAEISLEEAEIPAPLIIATHPPYKYFVDAVTWLAELGDQASGLVAPLPSLVSVQRADVAGLVLADIDLRNCHFAGAHHLDQLQLTTADAFHLAPSLLARRRGGGRQALAEECRWRQTRPGWRGRRWHHTTSELFGSPLLKEARRPGPAELAAIYRRLRKGREDAKNEPGAADFYYGEMEMRRHAHNTPWAERLLLWLYWLTAGYALRASRALATLAAVLAVLAVGFWQVGFGQHHPSYWASLVYAGLATLSLEGKAKVLADQLTLPGELLRISLRLTGPVLFALALLSIRNRVKR